MLIERDKCMKYKFLPISIFITGLLLISGQEIRAQQSVKITLAGYNHTPPVSTSASGLVTVELQKDTLKVEGEFSNLENWYHGAYIHAGKKGERGNQLIRLKAEVNEERTGGNFKRKDNSFVLNEAQKVLLKKGELYINISSYDHKGGEIRGQIPPMGN